MLIYKGKPIAEPGNVDFGSANISGIGDGTSYSSAYPGRFFASYPV